MPSSLLELKQLTKPVYSTPNLRYLWNSVPLLTCFTFTVWNASLFHSFDIFLTLATFSLFYTEHFTTTAKVLATFAILSSSYIQDCLCHVFTFVLTTFSSTFLNIILPLLSLLVKGLLVGNTRQPHMGTSNFSSDKWEKLEHENTIQFHKFCVLCWIIL